MALKDYGVIVGAVRDGQKLQMSEGCLRGVTPGKLSLVVLAPRHLKVVRLDNEKKVHVQTALSPNGDIRLPGYEDSSLALYAQTVEIRVAANGGLDAQYPANNLRLITYDGGALFSFWEVSIVCQNDRAYLTQQLAERFGVWHEKGKVTCENAKRWEQLLEIISGMVKEQNITLPDKPVPSPMPKQNGEKLKPGVGRVKWYKDSAQAGCVLTDKGEAKVIWAALPGKGFKYLRPGDIVSFPKVTPVPPGAGTSFKIEILNVDGIVRAAQPPEPIPHKIESGKKGHFRPK